MNSINKLYFQEGKAKLRDDGFIDLTFIYLCDNGREDQIITLKGVVDNPIVTISNDYCGPKELTSEMLDDWRNYKEKGTVSFQFVGNSKDPGKMSTLEIEDIQKIRGIDE